MKMSWRKLFLLLMIFNGIGLNSTQVSNEKLLINNEDKKKNIKNKGKLYTGSTHFKGVVREKRSSAYTLDRAISEFLDNVILLCDNIDIYIEFDNINILSIVISDNYKNGIENILLESINNPFNMTHMRYGQNNDDEISQFGQGFKAAAISTSHKLTVYTKVKNKYYEVIMDINKMCVIDDCDESFCPEIYEIDELKYKNNHKYENGTTFKLDQILDIIYKKNTSEELLKDLEKKLLNNFEFVIKKNNVNISLNNIKLSSNFSYFNEKECKPFSRKFKIYKYLDNNNNICYCAKIDDDIYLLNQQTQKLNKNKQNNIQYEYIDSISTDGACIEGETTFTMYHPHFSCKSNKYSIPCNRVKIYNTHGRCFGNWASENSTNSSDNYTDTFLIASKKILTDLGLTYNKNISRDNSNDIVDFLKKTLKKACNYNADTGTEANRKLYNKALRNNIYVSEERKYKTKKPTSKKEDEEYEEIKELKKELNPPSNIVDSSQTIESKNSHNKSNIKKSEVTKVSSKITQIESYDTENDILEISNKDKFDNLENTMVTQEETLPSEEESSPSKEKLPSEETLPSEEETLPSEEETLPSEEETLPSEEETLPSKEESSPSEEESSPSEEKSSSSEESPPSEEASTNKKVSPPAKSIDRGPKTDTHIGYDSMTAIINIIKKYKVKFESHKEDFRSEYINLRKEFSQNCDYNAINKNEMYLIERLSFIEIINAIEWLYEQNYTSKNTCVVRGADINRLFKKIDNNTN